MGTLDYIFHPDTFFENIVRYRPIFPQLSLHFLLGFAFASDVLALYFTAGDAITNYEAILLILIVVYLITPLLIWAALTTLIYSMAYFLDAQARFGTLLRMTGWASIPLFGTYLSWGVGRYLALRDGNPCTVLHCEELYTGTIERNVQHIYAHAASATGSETFLLAFSLGVVFLIVTTAYWAKAIYHCTTFNRWGAWLTAGGGLASLLIIYSFFTF